MRPEIAQSWKRSGLCGVDPAMRYDGNPCADIDPSSQLLQAASPILDEMERQIEGTGFCGRCACPSGNGRGGRAG